MEGDITSSDQHPFETIGPIGEKLQWKTRLEGLHSEIEDSPHSPHCGGINDVLQKGGFYAIYINEGSDRYYVLSVFSCHDRNGCLGEGKRQAGSSRGQY